MLRDEPLPRMLRPGSAKLEKSHSFCAKLSPIMDTEPAAAAGPGTAAAGVNKVHSCKRTFAKISQSCRRPF